MADNHAHYHYRDEIHGAADVNHDHEYANIHHDHGEYADEFHRHDSADLWGAIQAVEDGIERMEEHIVSNGEKYEELIESRDEMEAEIGEIERKLDILISVLSQDSKLKTRILNALEENLQNKT